MLVPLDMRQEPSRGGTLTSALAWGSYLASSWTWCIGMFLPLLLMRDHGWLGWVVFAAPNVLGAAAMGWTLRTREQSRAMVSAHLPAMLGFSFITRAFQWFFAFGLLATALRDGTLPAILGALVIALIASAADLRTRRTPWVGLVVWILSFALIAAARRVGGLPDTPTVGPLDDKASLAGLLASCVFGFLLCPYLDLTFHRARAEAGRPRVAFGFGFGVLFLAMILGTAAYAGLAWHVDTLAAVLVGMHVAAQIGYTAEVHSAEAKAAAKAAGDSVEDWARWLPLGSMLAGLGGLVGVWALSTRLGGQAPAFEWGYRLFMGFYGLVFPAYVLIAVVPTWGSPERPTGAMLRAWGVASLVAMPAMYLAFIRKEMNWVWAGLGVVLVAAWLARRAGRERPLRTPAREEPKDD
jgi:hypothetical protein